MAVQTNVTDFENFLRSFIVTQIKKKYPDVDASQNSSFDDLFIKPMIETIAPIVNLVNKIELMYSLESAEYMSEEDLDSIGVYNYGIPRNQGAKATTTVVFSFNRISETEDTIIPLGVVVETSEGLQFKTTTRKIYSYEEMLSYYNPSTLTYDVESEVEAASAGVEYNVPENQITTCSTNFNNFLTSVTNTVEVTNGVDKESNLDYAKRLQQYYVTRNSNTVPGYIATIKEVTPEVQDVKVVGKGDSEMIRDKVTVVIDENTTDNINIGGKTDIYIKGSNLTNLSASTTINSGKLKLSELHENINIATVSCVNLTEPEKTVIFSVSNVESDCFVTIDNATNQSYSSNVVSLIRVSYEDTQGKSIINEFNVGISSVDLQVPFKDLISVVNADDSEISYDNSHYDIIRTDIFGNIIDSTSPFYMSTQEYVTVKFKNMDGTVNGTIVSISYNVSDTLTKLKTYFEDEQNRIITTDLLIKEARPIYLNIHVAVKTSNGNALSETESLAIINSITQIVNGLLIGQPVRESDILGNLYKDQSVITFLGFVKLPFEAFYVPANQNDPVVDTRTGTLIEVGSTEYVVVNKVIVSEFTQA